jgi:hypothetical protein
MPTMTIEKRRRGAFGWIVAGLFWCFNIWMIYAVVAIVSSSAQHVGQLSDKASKVGATISATIGFTMILWIWLFGAIILGLMMLFSRGKKIIVTKEIP